jgi:hypothetical protein
MACCQFFRLAAVRILLALAGGMLPAKALASDDSLLCPISMTDAITLEREQIEHLFRERGLAYELTANLAVDLQDKVETYLSYEQSSSDRRDRALLFYIGNADVLCVMYWRIGDEASRNVFIVEQLAASPGEIVPRVDELVVAMQDAATSTLRRAEPVDGADSASRGATTLNPTAGRAVPEILAELSELLFPGAIADHVGDLASLTIIPCLNIGIVPFAALDPDRDGRALVEDAIVNIEAELRHIYEDRAFSWEGALGVPAIFGNPHADADDEWAFPLLPGAEREALAIAAALKTTALVGAAVTPDSVIDLIGDAGYVHIAAHGLSSVDDPLDGSFLALTGGRLTARQIQHLDLRGSPLVVLSACQTGLGGPLDAGIIGLARGFVVAGAAATVATLWNVDDAVTERIMIDFVSNLQTMSPGEALRRAQQVAMQLHPHPRYWAGFMLFGSRILTRLPG